MNDQGEKIVLLARALLNSPPAELPISKKPLSITLSLKALCLTTILAASTGSAVSALMHEDERPLNRYERFELRALVYYTAQLNHVSEEDMSADLVKNLGVRRVDDITAGDFSVAQRFLWKMAQ